MVSFKLLTKNTRPIKLHIHYNVYTQWRCKFFFRERSEDSFMVGRFPRDGQKILTWSEDSAEMIGRFLYGRKILLTWSEDSSRWLRKFSAFSSVGRFFYLHPMSVAYGRKGCHKISVPHERRLLWQSNHLSCLIALSWCSSTKRLRHPWLSYATDLR